MADDRKGMDPSRCGAKIREAIMRGIPALGDLTQRVQRQAQRGYITAIDGRKLFTRSEHSALNTLFQGDGAIVMKTSLCFLWKWVRQHGIDAYKVLDMHDEGQNIVLQSDAELFGELAVKSIKQAGKYLGVRCPLDGEYKIGYNWAEVH